MLEQALVKNVPEHQKLCAKNVNDWSDYKKQTENYTWHIKTKVDA